ncbi:MAG: hypothetical protein WDO56_06375 [Gammaproteobacteria bacterium]
MKKVKTAVHVSELPTEVVAELGKVETPDDAHEFDGEYERALKEIEQLMTATSGRVRISVFEAG